MSIANLSVVAAIHDHIEQQNPERWFSASGWTQSESIAILGYRHRYAPAVQALNQALFKALANELMDQEESRTRKTWFILDELTNAGRIDVLPVLTGARSKGSICALGIQSQESLFDSIGEHAAKAALDQIGNAGYCDPNTYEAAEYASKQLGEEHVLTRHLTTSGPTRSVTSSPEGSSTTVGEQSYSITESETDLRLVSPGDLMRSQSVLGGEQGVRLHFKLRDIGTYWVFLPHSFVDAEVPSRTPPVESYVPWDESVLDQPLRPWTDDERAALGLSLGVEDTPFDHELEDDAVPLHLPDIDL